jgi:hypothetical protein
MINGEYVMELKLNSKQDYFNLFNTINDPLVKHRNASGTRILYGHNGVGYGTKIAGVEGFARYLWGAGPAIELLPPAEVAQITTGMVNGTNPEHPDYWGDLKDYDQRMVEMPAIALALLHGEQLIWQRLTPLEQQAVVQWLAQIFAHKCADGNWQFFKIIVALVLQQLGQPYDEVDYEAAKANIARCYLADGWYQDSSRGRQDYYTPFAFQYYGLMYSTLVPADPLSATFKKRAAVFMQQYLHFFADDGANIPFGRSMTYRYAVVAFWAAVVYAKVEDIDLGMIKGIINRNLRWWLKKPIFDSGELLTLGYTYPQLLMTEPYNSPQSPYWSNKIFLLLALPETAAYWSVKEKSYPPVHNVELLPQANFLAVHHHGHSELLNAGQAAPNYHVLANEKYLKFAYSSQFGFSIPRGNQLKEEAVMDSMIGVQATDTTILVSKNRQNAEAVGQFFVRNRVEDIEIGTKAIASTWKLNEHMKIRTWLTSLNGWQIRVHKLVVDQAFTVYETGYAIENNPDEPGQVTSADQDNCFVGAKGFSGIVNLWSAAPRQQAGTAGFPNTNVMTPELTFIPGLETNLAAGSHVLVTGVFANADGPHGVAMWQEKPVVTVAEKTVTLKQGATTVTVLLEGV